MNWGLIALISGAVIYGLASKSRAISGFDSPLYGVSGELVSIIVPTLQEEEYLPNLLTSIYNQTYKNIEVIISDSSSPESKERTQQVIDEWKYYLNVKMVNSPKLNVSQGRNIGAQHALGSMLCFLDADCIMESGYIEKLVTDIQNGALLAHGMDCTYDNDIRNALTSLWLIFKPNNYTTGRGILIRTDIFNAIGGYDINLDPSSARVREDLDLGRRVEQAYGSGSVFLDTEAFSAESSRRPLLQGLSNPNAIWGHRGYRKNVVID